MVYGRYNDTIVFMGMKYHIMLYKTKVHIPDLPHPVVYPFRFSNGSRLVFSMENLPVKWPIASILGQIEKLVT